uniref:GTP-binding protein n=1 Tax=Gemmiger formicilis TaxID=745368 RepID=UPI0040270344
MAEKKTKIDIFSGFLGAGKTTLIKKLIKEAFAGEQIVLIENEFGEIGIDGGFMREAGIQVNELNSGCICCSLVGDFREALKKVVETYHPDRILIEPSGVGKLSDVTRAVEGVAEDLPVILNSFVTVADVNKVKMYMKNFGEFYDDQVSHASCIILSRTGNASEEKVAAAVALLAEKNPTATIVTTDWTVLTGAQIVSVMDGKRDLVAELLTEARAANVAHADEDEHEHHHHHHHDDGCSCGHDHDADEIFESWGAETPRKYTEEEVTGALAGLDEGEKYGIVLRAKGIVPCTDGSWIHFDYVPGEQNIRRGPAGITGRLCVIGSELKEHDLDHLFCLD